MKQKQFVFVYGTLRKNEGNYHYLKDAEIVAGQAWTNGDLFDTGSGYPALKESVTGRVYGELYLVTNEQLRKIDLLEGYDPKGQYNLYNRKKQIVFYDTGKQEAYLYIIAEHNVSMLRIPIPSCDWKLHKFPKKKQNILYFAYGSCMDDARFILHNKNHYFQNVKGRGELKGYTLRFTRKSDDGSRADIVEEGGMVEGKVYEILVDCLPYLYRREGVNNGCYRPTFVDLSLNGTLVKDVLTFTVDKKEVETAPPSWYIEEILRGGSGFLSSSYISVLKDQVRTKFGIVL